MFSRRIKPNRFTPTATGIDTSANPAERRKERVPYPVEDPLQGNPASRSTPASKQPETSGFTANLNPTTLWLRRADQLLLGFLLIALLVLLVAFRWKLSGGGRGEIEIVSQQPREYFYAIDVNKASWVEWAQLDGIGEKLGRRIVSDRQDRGPFKSIDEIRRVRGLGPKMIEKLRPFLKCEEENDQVQRTSNPSESRQQSRGIKELR